jgi:hypothetical protein
MTDLTQIPNNPLSTLRRDIRAHWQKYRPQMTARLEEAGELADRVETAAHQTEEAVLSYVEKAQGTILTPAQAFWQAWEIYRNEWAFLPAEVNEDEEAELDRELEARYGLWRDDPEEEEDASGLAWWEKYDLNEVYADEDEEARNGDEA